MTRASRRESLVELIQWVNQAINCEQVARTAVDTTAATLARELWRDKPDVYRTIGNIDVRFPVSVYIAAVIYFSVSL